MKSFRSNSAMSMSSLVFSMSFANYSASLSKMTPDSSLYCFSFSSCCSTNFFANSVGGQLSRDLTTDMRDLKSIICSSLISSKIETLLGGFTNSSLFMRSRNLLMASPYLSLWNLTTASFQVAYSCSNLAWSEQTTSSWNLSSSACSISYRFSSFTRYSIRSSSTYGSSKKAILIKSSLSLFKKPVEPFSWKVLN